MSKLKIRIRLFNLTTTLLWYYLSKMILHTLETLYFFDTKLLRHIQTGCTCLWQFLCVGASKTSKLIVAVERVAPRLLSLISPCKRAAPPYELRRQLIHNTQV